MLPKADFVNGFAAVKEAVVIPIVYMRTAEADPILLPSVLLVRIVTMPRIRRDGEHAPALDFNTLFRRFVVPAPPLRNVNQLIIIEHTAPANVKKIVVRMPCRGGG